MNHTWILGFPMTHESFFFFNIFSIPADQYEDKGSLMNRLIILWLAHYPEGAEDGEPTPTRARCQILPVRVRGAGPCGCTLQTEHLCRGRCWTWGTAVCWGGAGTSRTLPEAPPGSPASRPRCCLYLYCCCGLPTDLERGGKKLHNLWLEASIVRVNS